MTHQHRICVAATLVGSLIVSAVSMISPAGAHTVTAHYPYEWPSTVTVIDWKFTPEFPTEFPAGTGFRQRMRDGAAQWNGVAGAALDFREVAQASANYAGRSCPSIPLVPGSQQGRNGMHFESVDGEGSTLAITRKCIASGGLYGSGMIFDFEILLDSAEYWYIHTGDAVGNVSDVWSVASHEFGHATGWQAHYDDSAPQSICADNSAQQTMCRYYYSDTERQRTLEDHDRHTFDGAY